MKDRQKTGAAVESYKHQDKRTNIPTEELRAFASDDDTRELLYPRDPSLDPQLVWKGKDEQDREALAVPVVPIYIQEKIQPRAIIEQVRAAAQRPKYAMAPLFGDFNGLPFDELIDFYQHQQQWTNRVILGDSMLVMSSLAEKGGLKGKVQMIYMDPPYGIRFGSNWQVSTRKRDVKDGRADDLTRQPEQIKAFRDTWALGIHSYLTYLRDRLTVARDLLTESGSIFVQSATRTCIECAACWMRYLATRMQSQLSPSQRPVALARSSFQLLAISSSGTPKMLPGQSTSNFTGRKPWVRTVARNIPVSCLMTATMRRWRLKTKCPPMVGSSVWIRLCRRECERAQVSTLRFRGNHSTQE